MCISTPEVVQHRGLYYKYEAVLIKQIATSSKDRKTKQESLYQAFQLSYMDTAKILSFSFQIPSSSITLVAYSQRPPSFLPS